MERKTPRTLFAVLLVALFLAAPGKAAEPTDLIEDRPSAISNVFGLAMDGLTWVWGKTTAAVRMILPMSPQELVKSVDPHDASELKTLLGYAGFKLKEIDSQVGIIPTIAFKFALTRELSEADWDYLEYRLEVSRFRTPGLGAEIQRAIVGTVMAINMSADYQVSELKVKILPLPQVAFSVTPKASALGEESSTLLRAIQHLEKRLRGEIAAVGGKMLPGNALYKFAKARDWLMGGAIALLALTVLVELRRHLRAEHLGRSGPGFGLTLLGAGALLWVGAALVPLSLLTMGVGIALFGLTALLVAAKAGAEPRLPPAVAEACGLAPDPVPAATAD